MKRKKFLALAASMVLCVSILAGCGGNDEGDQTSSPVQEQSQEPTGEEAEGSTEGEAENSNTEDGEASGKAELSDDPLVRMTQGYYTYAYPVEGIGDFTYYFHFYEEAPVIGNVFYAGFALNQITFAGTYQVEEKDYEYACYASREEATADNPVFTTGTAPYTITFYDFAGNELDSCGFDGDIIYNDMENISGVGSGPAFYPLDAEGEASPYYEQYQAEVGQIYLDFVAEDPTSTLTLYHNGTYMDLVNFLVEGTWEMREASEGYEYILTPKSDSDTAAVLLVAADQIQAEYTPDGGESVTMTNTAEAGPQVAWVMKGEAPIPGQETNAELVLNLYDDGTCTLAAAAFGQEIPLDDGTWSMGENGYTITFQMTAAGELVSEMDSETKQVSIQYVQQGTMLGDIDTILVIVME